MIFLWGLSTKDYFSEHNKLNLISNLSFSLFLLVYPDWNNHDIPAQQQQQQQQFFPSLCAVIPDVFSSLEGIPFDN